MQGGGKTENAEPLQDKETKECGRAADELSAADKSNRFSKRFCMDSQQRAAARQTESFVNGIEDEQDSSLHCHPAKHPPNN